MNNGRGAGEAEEPLPAGRYGAAHYRAVHRHLFQDVYAWAGRYRTVRTSKNGNAFCYPEHIARSMDKLFERLRARPFTGGADFPGFAEQGCAAARNPWRSAEPTLSVERRLAGFEDDLADAVTWDEFKAELEASAS